MKVYSWMLAKRDFDADKLRVIGRGLYRTTAVDDRHPHLIYKYAPRGRDTRSSFREIAYYRRLIHLKVPFIYIPRFLGAFKTDRYIVMIEKNMALTAPDTVKLSLEDALTSMDLNVELLQQAYLRFKDYIFTNRIVTSDMVPHNFILEIVYEDERKQEEKRYNLYLIDGIGAPQAIPLSNYSLHLFLRRNIKECHKIIDAIADATCGLIRLQF